MTRQTTPHRKDASAGRYSGTEQQEAAHGGRQQGIPARKKPGVAGYRPDRGPHGGKVDGDAPRGPGAKDDDKR